MSLERHATVQQVRILLADDHELVRHGLKAVLQERRGWQVCGEASNGREAVEKTQTLNPDVVIVDLSMPVMNGVEATRRIVNANSHVKVLVLTIHQAEQIVSEVLEAGAKGFLLKSDAAQELINAVEAVLLDKPYFTAKVADEVLDGFLERRVHRPQCKTRVLTARERQVVQLLAEGRTSREVASELGLSVKTAESHRANVMRKLQVHSVGELVLYALRNQIVPSIAPMGKAHVASSMT